MNAKKLSFCTVALFIFAAFLTVLPVSGEAAPVMTLKLANQFPTDHTATAMCKKLAADVEKKTNGRIAVKVYPANQLGDYTLVYEELIRGTIDMALISVPSQFDPRMELVYINGFVPGYSQIEKAFKPGSWIFTKMDEFHNRLGVKFLGFNVEGMIGIATTKPVKDPLNPNVNKGVLVRVPNMDVYKLGAEAMGYRTVTIPYADMYTALQTGVADGASSIPPAAAYTILKDVIKHWYQLNYSVENESYLMSKMTWDKLSAGDKKIIAEATAKVAAESIQTAKKDDQKYMDLMKKRGIVVHTYTDKELQPQMKAVSKTWDKLSKTMTKELMDGFKKEFAPK